MVQLITPVILSGGSGTRLWPLSRPECPKQLLPVTGPETMLQLTARRLDDGIFSPAVIVANAAHADTIEAQLSAVDAAPQSLILEPAARNTAPAIALAALAVGADATPLLVMPSDHAIGDVASFLAAVRAALPLAMEGWLVTFGIEPTGPQTGYGYIRLGDQLAPGARRAKSFVEKPDSTAAQAMIVEGGYVWNSGIFLFRADAYLEALSRHAPTIENAARGAMLTAIHDGRRVQPGADMFEASPSLSIDYAVMEKEVRVAVVPVAMAWSDVGSWDALYALGERDAQGNVLNGDVLAVDSNNCLVRTGEARVALVGVSDLIIVALGKDILVMPRGRAQDVRKVVDLL